MFSIKEQEKLIELKKLQLSIAKAEAVKLELDMKIDERKLDIDRMLEHISLQDQIILETNKKIGELANG